MRTYILYFAAIVLVANGGYALVHLGDNGRLVSFPLLLGSTSAAIVALLVVRQRLRQAEKSRKE